MKKIISVFGDSIIYGIDDAEMGGWVNRLKVYLKNDEENYFVVYNLGIPGDDTDRLLERFAGENEAREPNVILIAIGINDSQYLKSKNGLRVPLERFESNLLEIIKQAKKFAQDLIFIGPIKVDESKTNPIKWNTDRYHSNKNADDYSNKIKEICKNNKLPFIEMMDLLTIDDLQDGVHPTPQGHEKMFQRIKDFLVNNKVI